MRPEFCAYYQSHDFGGEHRTTKVSGRKTAKDKTALSEKCGMAPFRCLTRTRQVVKEECVRRVPIAALKGGIFRAYE